MKINRSIVIIVLTTLMVGTWYFYANDIRESTDKYNIALEKGEQAEISGLYEKAIEYYKECLSYKNTLEIQNKILVNLKELYGETKTFSGKKNIEKFLVGVRNDFPNSAEPFEWAVEFYQEEEKWKSVVQLLREADSKNIYSEGLVNLERQSRYQYEMDHASFEQVKELTENLYAAKNDTGWCYITRKGNSYINGSFEFATPLMNDMACVKKNGQVYIIDGEGEKQMILPSEINNIDFADSRWLPVMIGSEYQFYNIQTGEKRGHYSYAGRFKDNMAAVFKGGAWNVVNEAGEEYSAVGYEDIVLSPTGSCYSDGYIIVKENGIYHFLNKQFNRAMEFTCEDLDFCRETVFAFCQNRKWGFANLDGSVLMEPIFENAKSYSNGFAAVMQDGKWGFIDEQGNIAIEFTFDDAAYFNDQGYCFVKKGEAWHTIHLLSWQ